MNPGSGSIPDGDAKGLIPTSSAQASTNHIDSTIDTDDNPPNWPDFTFIDNNLPNLGAATDPNPENLVSENQPPSAEDDITSCSYWLDCPSS